MQVKLSPRILSTMVPLRVFELFRKRLHLAVMLGVMAILVGPAQVVPALLSVGVALEHSHVVRVAFDGTTFRLVLRHESQSAVPLHRHGLASQILCLVAERSSDHPDHCASFATGSAWEELRSQYAAGTPPCAVACWGLVDSSGAASVGSLVSCREVRDLGPPVSDALSLILRATVIQI